MTLKMGLALHTGGMELNISRLLDDAIHVSGYGGENGGVV
jgi:hypothetical protein